MVMRMCKWPSESYAARRSTNESRLEVGQTKEKTSADKIHFPTETDVRRHVHVETSREESEKVD